MTKLINGVKDTYRNKKETSLIILILIITILFNIFNIKNIIVLATAFCIMYGIFFLYCFKTNKSIKNMLLSAEFIYTTIFFVYAIPASIMFIMDNYNPRIYYFTIDNNTMSKTLRLYFTIFNFLFSLILLFKGPKTYSNINSEKKKSNNSNIFYFFDFIAAAIVVYFYYLHFRNGISILSDYFHNIRELIKSEIHNLNTYIYLYMIPYTFSVFTKFLNNKGKDLKKAETISQFIRGSIVVLFWGLSIFTDRRNLVNLLFMCALVLLAKMKKLDFKKIIIGVVVIICLLSISFFRSGAKLNSFTKFFFYANGEFIYTNYVTQYYIEDYTDYKYGKTYIIDTLLSAVPRKIYPEKPLLLSQQFQKDAKTNVAYAFNPVAEGIINFGMIGASFVVPIIIYGFIVCSYYFGKKNIEYYAIILSSSIGFFRGTFSNTIFTTIVMLVFMYFLNSEWKWKNGKS